MASDSFAFLLRSFLFAELLYVFTLWMVSRACSAAAKSPTLKFPCVSKEWLSFARAPFAASSAFLFFFDIRALRDVLFAFGGGPVAFGFGTKGAGAGVAGAAVFAVGGGGSGSLRRRHGGVGAFAAGAGAVVAAGVGAGSGDSAVVADGADGAAVVAGAAGVEAAAGAAGAAGVVAGVAAGAAAQGADLLRSVPVTPMPGVFGIR